MRPGPVRPRFRIVVYGTVEEQMARVASAVTGPESRCVSRVLGNHLDITVVPEDRHRWSPCVHLEFLESGTETIVNGLIGPHPSVWTLFAFTNITIGLSAAFAGAFGLVQRGLGQPAWGLWALPIAAVLFGVMYVVAQTGRRLAAEQTGKLTRLVEDALGVTIS